MLDVAFVLLAIALLLILVGGIQPLAARLSLPPPVLFAVFGIAIGIGSTFLSQSSLAGGFGSAILLLKGLPVTSPA